MQIPIFSNTSAANTATAARYINLWATRPAAWGTADDVGYRAYIYRDHRITNLVVNLKTAPGVGNSRTYTVTKNNVNTGLSVTISGTDTQGQILGSVTGVSGDYWALKTTGTGTPTDAALTTWSCILETADDVFVTITSSINNPSSSSRNYINPTHGYIGAGYNGTEASQTRFYSPGYFTITSLYARCKTAPGAGKSYTYSIYKNGSREASSDILISGTATTGSVTGLNISLSPNDYISLSSLPSGTPTFPSHTNFTMEVVPQVIGESFIASAPQTVVGTADTYFPGTYPGLTGTATEADHLLICPPGLTMWMKNFYVTTAAPGTAGSGKTKTFRIRKNSANANNSILITDTETTGSDLTSVDSFTGLDFISGVCQPTNTANTGNANFSNIVYIPNNPLIIE